MPFPIFDRSMAEKKLGSFFEDPEFFSKEFTRLMRSFDLTWGYLPLPWWLRW